jgi:hypothetical protein
VAVVRADFVFSKSNRADRAVQAPSSVSRAGAYLPPPKTHAQDRTALLYQRAAHKLDLGPLSGE